MECVARGAMEDETGEAAESLLPYDEWTEAALRHCDQIQHVAIFGHGRGECFGARQGRRELATLDQRLKPL